MSVVRPQTCLFCNIAGSFRLLRPARRKFHSSRASLDAKPRHPGIETRHMKEYSKRKGFQKKTSDALQEQYSQEQWLSVKSAKEVIDSADEVDTPVRQDPWAVKYFDDFTEIDPVVDKPVRAPWTNIDDTSRLKTTDELEDDLIKLMRKLPDTDDPEKYDERLWDDFDQNLRLTIGKEEAERNPRTALAPEIPKLSDTTHTKKKVKGRDGENAEEDQPSPALVRLMQMTGYDRKQIAQLRVKSIISHRVVNQTRLGKIGKQYFLSIAGNGQGLIGIGEGKAEEPQEARLQSQYRAIRNMQPILRYEGRTIYGDVKGKVSATELELYARPPGFGLRCQQYIWEICKCAGISDLAARVTRSRNPMNTVKATVQALLSQKDPEDIARARGKKLVDVRKVYYAGQI